MQVAFEVVKKACCRWGPPSRAAKRKREPDGPHHAGHNLQYPLQSLVADICDANAVPRPVVRTLAELRISTMRNSVQRARHAKYDRVEHMNRIADEKAMCDVPSDACHVSRFDNLGFKNGECMRTVHTTSSPLACAH